jgi:hypothetical protein
MSTTIGDFLDVVTAPVRAVVNAVTSVTETAVDIVTSIPGVDFASEQLVDFAKVNLNHQDDPDQPLFHCHYVVQNFQEQKHSCIHYISYKNYYQTKNKKYLDKVLIK